MASNLITSTLQAAVLAGVSNLLAQLLQAYQGNTSPTLNLVNFTMLLRFMSFQLLSTPPNVLWQNFLEKNFPSEKADEKGQKKLHKGNTLTKFVLDQTFGAVANTCLFIAGIGALKGKDGATIWTDYQRDFWPLITAGWKVWPFVSLLCFTIVPPSHRILVANTFGLFWNIFLSFMSR